MNEEIRARMEKLNTMKSEGGGKFYVWCDNNLCQIATDLERLIDAIETLQFGLKRITKDPSLGIESWEKYNELYAKDALANADKILCAEGKI